MFRFFPLLVLVLLGLMTSTTLAIFPYRPHEGDDNGPLPPPMIATVDALEIDQEQCSPPDCLLEANKGKLFEVDILLTPEMQAAIKSMTVGDGVEVQGAINFPSYRWPNAVVPYQIDNGLNSKILSNIRQAIAAWENSTCVRFIPREPEHEDYLLFSNGLSCSSYIGRIGGPQPLYVGRCNYASMVIHEIGHALGFLHEQSRTDRDDHVKVLWENIEPGKEGNFFSYSSAYIDSVHVPYDKLSIMQYSSFSFSLRDDDGNPRPTIVLKDDDGLIQPPSELSLLDIIQTNIVYDCPEIDCTYRWNYTGNSSSHDSSPETDELGGTSFIIQNKATGKCVSITGLTIGTYPSTDPIDSPWSVTLAECDPHQLSQYWSWIGNHIVNNSTKLCLSSTTSGDLILRSCNEQYTTESRMQFLCSGYFIDHPQTEECLSAVDADTVQGTGVSVGVSNMLEVAVQELSNKWSNIMEGSDDKGYILAMIPCNISNLMQAWWRMFEDEATDPNSRVVTPSLDKSICAADHQIHECYNETIPNAHGWLRCTVHGYFVSGIVFHGDASRVVSSITCCQSPYSYWEHPNDPILLDDTHAPITCDQKARWTPPTLGESGFQCDDDQYMRGVRIGSNIWESDTYYSLITIVECCQPVHNKRVYRHCYDSGQPATIGGQLTTGGGGSTSSTWCTRRGYFVTSLTEVVRSTSAIDGDLCDKMVKCCV